MIKINILGIRVSQIDRKNALETIKKFLSSKKFHQIVTPNPEIILKAIEDEELFYIINEASLSLADGVGIKIAAMLSGKYLERLTGADLVQDILKIAEEKKIKVAVINWRRGFSTRTDIERAIKKIHPELDIFVENSNRKSREVSKEFLVFKPSIVFVNFGAPYQEKFIYATLRKINGIKLAVGVGGAFDFLTGRRKRAPFILRFIGLEWLWRLGLQPKRVGRIFNATFGFSCKFLIYKLYYRFLYRQNVSCVLYKKDKDKYKILVVERRDERGHWQLPQGGTDGENLMVAGARELAEELNCSKVIPKRAFKNVHKYKFGARVGEDSVRKNSSKKYTGFKGQKQGLFVAEFSGKDEDIKVNFWDHSRWKWVDRERLMDTVHVIRKRGVQRFLNCFEEYIKNNS